LPRIGAIRYDNPLITAKPLPPASEQGRGDRRRVMPWEALCLFKEAVWPRND